MAEAMTENNTLPDVAATVHFRKLGNTGFDVSTIGFGTWQIAGGRWAAGTAPERVTLLRQARDLGVNIFDVAVVYGQFRDEKYCLRSAALELLGEAFHDSRERVFYCIKLGQFDELTHRGLYEPSRLVEQFRHALKELKTDYIDICLIHAPSLHEVKRGIAISVLQTLQALGDVRAIGYCFENDPVHVQEALGQRIDVIMLQYNLLDRHCSQVIDEAGERGVGIIVGGPFKRGYLTGKYSRASDLPLEDGYWNWNVSHNRGKVDEILNSVELMRKQHDSPESLRRTALRFILEKRAVASAVVGHRELKEVIENALSVGD